MIDAAEQARALVADIELAELEQDRQRRDALLWNFTVLGEAANAVSVDLKEAHPEVPWNRPAATRNRIVHGYWSIDLSILYTTARESLETMIKSLRQVQQELESE
ncbi:HepT-like ribonuclease domain-containing protein [Haloechinothrix alba]|nr:HepT-like ribonuclease domain-containing protein [Haloechinothrix alba]